MNTFYEKMKPIVLVNLNRIVAFLRGVFASEGAVVLKPSGIPHHVDISNKNLDFIDFVTECFRKIGVERGKYFYEKGMKFPIHNRKNFEILLRNKILSISPEKQRKLEEAMKKYQRFLVKGDEMEKQIMRQLDPISKTYDDLAFALKKGRSTIQSHYIPLLEKKGFEEEKERLKN